MLTTFQNQIKKALAEPEIEGFDLKDRVIASDECILATPKGSGISWTKNNLILRSCIFRKSDYLPISLGHKKFFNHTEKPDLYPDMEKFKDSVVEMKMDGSLIICSKYKKQSIIRTRGVVSAFTHDTGPEIKYLLRSNLSIQNNELINSEQYSLLFEHITPNNRIVIKYEEPELILIGVICHEDYSCFNHVKLDLFANEIKVKRPPYYFFNTIGEIVKTCEILKGVEGYVLSYNNYQDRIKIKGAEYLAKHRLRDHLRVFSHVVDFYFLQDCPNYEKFYNAVVENIDFETAEEIKEEMAKICQNMKKTLDSIKEMKEYVEKNKEKPRKEFAMDAIKIWKDDVGFIFTILDKGELIQDQIKKLFLKIIK